MKREGGSHSIWISPDGKMQAIPRHREIEDFLARSIFRKLGLPDPARRNPYSSSNYGDDESLPPFSSLRMIVCPLSSVIVSTQVTSTPPSSSIRPVIFNLTLAKPE